MDADSDDEASDTRKDKKKKAEKDKKESGAIPAIPTSLRRHHPAVVTRQALVV